jgi:hypothetical protein
MRIRGVPTTMYSRPEKLLSSEAGQYFLSGRCTVEECTPKGILCCESVMFTPTKEIRTHVLQKGSEEL